VLALSKEDLQAFTLWFVSGRPKPAEELPAKKSDIGVAEIAASGNQARLVELREQEIRSRLSQTDNAVRKTPRSEPVRRNVPGIIPGEQGG
jgi:hypothetical protein